MEKRISGNTAIILILFAICVDLGQAILEWITLGISDVWDILIVDPMMLGLLWFVFWRLGVNFTKTRALVFVGIGLLEFIPVIKEFPLWTIDVLAVIAMTTAEDKLISKVGSSRASAMMKDPRRLRRMSRVMMNNMNKIPGMQRAMGNTDTSNNTPKKQQPEVAESMPDFNYQAQNKNVGQQNIPQNQNIRPEDRRLGRGDKKNIPRTKQDVAREAIVQKQKDNKSVANKNNKQSVEKKDDNSNQTYEGRMRDRASFVGDFGRQNNSSSQQPDRDTIIRQQRVAKENRPQLKYIKNANSPESKKAA